MTANVQALVDLVIEAHDKYGSNPYPGEIARYLDEHGVVAKPSLKQLRQFDDVWNAIDKAKEALQYFNKVAKKIPAV